VKAIGVQPVSFLFLLGIGNRKLTNYINNMVVKLVQNEKIQEKSSNLGTVQAKMDSIKAKDIMWADKSSSPFPKITSCNRESQICPDDAMFQMEINIK
jgi:hypothetical protein